MCSVWASCLHSMPSTPLTLLLWTDRIAFVMCLIQCPGAWHIMCTQQRLSWDFLNFSFIFSFSSLETFRGSLLYRAELGNCVLWTDLAHRHILFGPCRENLNWLSMSKSWEFTYKFGFMAYLEMLKTLVTLSWHSCLQPCREEQQLPLLQGMCTLSLPLFHSPNSYFH